SFTTGVLVAQNGVITDGEQDSIYYSSDSNNDAYSYPQFQQISGGSYSTTPAGNLQITLNIGPGETETLSGILASGANGFVTQLYGSIGSGTLDLQTSKPAPSGGYVI